MIDLCKSLKNVQRNMTKGGKPMTSITGGPLYLCNATATYHSQLSLTDL